VPRLCDFYPGICLTTEEKARKNRSQGSRRVLVYILYITKTPTQLQYPHIHTPTLLKNTHTPTLLQKTHTHPHITKPTHTHTHTHTITKHTHTHTHTLQNTHIHTSQNNTKHHSTNQNKPNTRYTQLL